MLRKPHFVVLLVAALALLVLLALPEPARQRLRLAWSSLFLPLFGLASSASAVAERVASSALPRATLASRVQTLELENERLQLALAEAQAAARENDSLRQMVGYPRRAGWQLKPVRVVGRDPANWWQSVHIDAGWRDGVTNDLAVLAPEGLVGRVAEAGAHLARVVLVGDPNCPVAAALGETGETGIIRGVGGSDLHDGLVVLSYLPRSALVRPGQRVVTSGQGGVFPPGVPVGEVVDARAVEAGIYIEARVRLAANLGALHRLWVKGP